MLSIKKLAVNLRHQPQLYFVANQLKTPSSSCQVLGHYRREIQLVVTVSSLCLKISVNFQMTLHLLLDSSLLLRICTTQIWIISSKP